MKSGWVTKKLGEIGTCKNGLNFKRAAVGKAIDIVGVGDFKKGLVVDDTTDLERLTLQELPEQEWYLQPNDIVFVRSNGSKALVGRAVIIKTKRPLTFSGFCIRYRIEDKCVDPDYLVRMVSAENFRRAMLVGRNASTINNVTQSILLSQVIRFPPLAEQKRIVAKVNAEFEKIDKLKANAEKNLANAKELFQSALDEAMRPKKGWVEKRLGEVCSKIGSGATPRGGKASYCSKGISLIRSMNVYDCAFEYSELAHINDIQAKELANVTIEANDVLINITGASVARCCVVPSDVIPARVNQHVAILRIADDRFLNPDFLCYTLVAPSKKSLLLGIGEAGSTRQALTKTDLTSFKIFIPDIFEQKRIVERVKALAQANETLQQNYARQVADCAEMRQAILREAFEGRL